jgi:molybdate transport repressor ModE-like protein
MTVGFGAGAPDGAACDNAPMIRVDIRPVWRFRSEAEREFDFQLIAILGALDATGKLTQAAEQAGVSYRHAWNLVSEWEGFFGTPLVTKSQGRGSTLTPLGERLLWAGRRAQARLAPELDNLAAEFARSLNQSLHEHAVALEIRASHDFAIAALRDLWLARGMDIALRYEGSFDALAALRRGECDVAGFHVPEGRLGELMRRRYAECLPAGEFRLITFAKRAQGLMVLAGNPKRIESPADLCRGDVRMVNRQRGSGTRALLEYIISSEGLDRALIRGYDSEEVTHGAVAALVAGRQADVGLGVQAAAALYGLDFVPLVVERYYLACRAGHVDAPPMSELLTMLRGDAFVRMVADLPGYDARGAGRILESFESVSAVATGTESR